MNWDIFLIIETEIEIKKNYDSLQTRGIIKTDTQKKEENWQNKNLVKI